MTRPDSYCNDPPENRCGTCRFGHLVAYKLDLLCFHGDEIRITGKIGYPVDAEHVELGGQDVGMLDGDEYDRVWATRVVDDLDVCDEWERKGGGA